MYVPTRNAGLANASEYMERWVVSNKLGADESVFVKAEIEKRFKPNTLEVTVKHKLIYGVSFYDITITDGIAWAREGIGEHHLGGPHQNTFFDRVAAGLVQTFSIERYLARGMR